MKIIALILFTLSFYTIYADQIMTTPDGKQVLLKDNGTWEYAKKDIQKNKKEPTFRKSYWGMTKNEVKKTEAIKIEEEDPDLLVYRGTISGFDCFIVYIFSDTILVRAKYIFTHKHSNDTEFIKDFSNLKELLIKKYGKQKSDDTIWENDLYKNKPSEWGMAVSVGHLKYFTNWKDADTSIWLALTGDNFDINLVIEYQSVKLADFESQNKEAQSLEDL